MKNFIFAFLSVLFLAFCVSLLEHVVVDKPDAGISVEHQHDKDASFVFDVWNVATTLSWEHPSQERLNTFQRIEKVSNQAVIKSLAQNSKNSLPYTFGRYIEGRLLS